jgi:hypothetical protein
VPRYYGGPAADPPNRLVYLLDHEYTPRALNWRRPKGADASRVALLRAAADKAGSEAVLALADIKTTHSAFAGDCNDTHYEVQELIDSEVALTHWTRPDGTRLEETSLSVNGTEVCASHPDRRHRALFLRARGLHGQLGQHAGPLVPAGGGRRVAP